MLPFFLAALAATAGTAAQDTPWPSFGNWTETAGGYEYILSGPAKLGKKVDFELDRCHYVWNLINDRAHCAEGLPPATAQECMDKLYERKKAVGDQGFLDMFAKDIGDAERFWGVVNNNSNLGDPKAWKAVEARAAVALPNGWGGTVTNFPIPNYSPMTCLERPMVRPLPEFRLKVCGDKNLNDGKDTNFGVLNIAVRDVAGGEFGKPGRSGVDIYASIWYGGAISEEHLEAERQHVIIEIVNMSLRAQRDIESGDFVVPVPPGA